MADGLIFLKGRIVAVTIIETEHIKCQYPSHAKTETPTLFECFNKEQDSWLLTESLCFVKNVFLL